MVTFAITAFGGVVIGILAVLVGGTGFLSTPFIQILFPGVTIGAIVGNSRIGGVFRGVGSTVTSHSLIEYRNTFTLIAIALPGIALGAWFIGNLNQHWLIPILLLAILVTESAPWLSQHMTKQTFALGTFLTGAYMGIFGAGTNLLLLALLRLQRSDDTDLTAVRAEANFAEFALGLIAVAVYFFHGNLAPSIWIPWSVGSFLGGLIGGALLHRVSRLRGPIQKIFLRASYVLALGVCLYVLY